MPTRPEAYDVGDKVVFLDLRVRLEGGEQVDVEMQSRRHLALRPRILFYWGRLYTGQGIVAGRSRCDRCGAVLGPSALVPIAETTVRLLRVANAIRVPPRPANESASLFALDARVQLFPASVERKIPSPKYESPELLASIQLKA